MFVASAGFARVRQTALPKSSVTLSLSKRDAGHSFSSAPVLKSSAAHQRLFLGVRPSFSNSVRVSPPLIPRPLLRKGEGERRRSSPKALVASRFDRLSVTPLLAAGSFAGGADLEVASA
jgi:hypothetical protein